MKDFYDYPTQVLFIEKNEVECYGADYNILSGIAYGENIICGCCGAIVLLEDVLWIKELDWIDIMDPIRGDDSSITDEDVEEYSVIVDRFIEKEGIEI